MFLLFQRRRAQGLWNIARAMTFWARLKTSLFGLAGLGLLAGLYFGFLRALRYLEAIQLIGGLLTWKLTAIALLTTFWMVAISNLIASLSTLYYAYDLPFLHASPAPPRSIFIDKAFETMVYASWMVGLAFIPYLLALGQVKHVGPGFYAAFAVFSFPFLALAAFLGILLTLALMYFFPSSRTREIVWILSSGSVALVYVVVRFVQPERLTRPDVLAKVTEYLRYLQAPTAPYLPSWWMTQGLVACTTRRWGLFLRESAALYGSFFAAAAVVIFLAERMYGVGLSGAQEGARTGRAWGMASFPEERLRKFLRLSSLAPILYWKERKIFFRDVRHWSQLMLILALMAVYVFSVWKLPLDTPELKSLGAFFNIGSAGFVLSALGLRFTFPAVSLEGRSFWVIKSAPLGLASFMREKVLFSAIPMTFLGGGIVLVSNYLLGADAFISWLSFGTTVLCALTLCVMGVGFGAIFPKFNLENIHQIESSAGGFIYMACAMGYVGATLAVESWLVQYHFFLRIGKGGQWDLRLVLGTILGLVMLNLVAAFVPWEVGRRTLEAFEGEGA